MLKKEKTCPLRSECRVQADREFAAKLFSESWEFFVVRRDPDTGKHVWFTECCEAAVNKLSHGAKLSPAACC